MDLARVVGSVVSTIKDSQLEGHKLLLIRPVNPSGEFIGSAMIAIDAIGAGTGETVFFVTGKEASFAFLPDNVPADVSIVAIVDQVHESTDRRARSRS
ncbi:MAG: ethanolamine utilization protein EutN [Acidobacteria bacterium]|nr:ethanolamine utilization protein EutN [Acidobacteriota bacterium]